MNPDSMSWLFTVQLPAHSRQPVLVGLTDYKARRNYSDHVFRLPLSHKPHRLLLINSYLSQTKLLGGVGTKECNLNFKFYSDWESTAIFVRLSQWLIIG